eukprot:scaffold279478_cov28-Tisochrysis_lutea.AAC.2
MPTGEGGDARWNARILLTFVGTINRESFTTAELMTRIVPLEVAHELHNLAEGAKHRVVLDKQRPCIEPATVLLFFAQRLKVEHFEIGIDPVALRFEVGGAERAALELRAQLTRMIMLGPVLETQSRKSSLPLNAVRVRDEEPFDRRCGADSIVAGNEHIMRVN